MPFGGIVNYLTSGSEDLPFTLTDSIDVRKYDWKGCRVIELEMI